MMNKKTLLTLIILAVAAIAYWAINKKPWGVNYKDIADFSIEDTAAIDKIFIADRDGMSSVLTKTGPQTWIINNNKLADFSKVQLLLETVKTMKVLRPIPESEHNSAVGDLATRGIKAEFYSKGDMVKTIYVGSATREENGTYMLIENSSKPYAVHIPGFFGYLTPRFISDSLIWRDRVVFNYAPDEIKSIEMIYNDANNSFTVNNENAQMPVLLNANKQVKPITDMVYLKYFVGSFKNLSFDGYDENQSPKLIDSLLLTKPVCVINITKKDGAIQSLKLHTKAIDKHTKQVIDEATGKEIGYDSERYWAFLNNDKSLMLVQQYNFGKVIRTINDFK
ncbi:MAG: DUF4340 domain-containing protein [Candidatus Methylacidiphilales bacterium]